MKRYTVIGVGVAGFTIEWKGRARGHWHAFEKAAKWFIKTEQATDIDLIACVPGFKDVHTPCESGNTCTAGDYLGDEADV